MTAPARRPRLDELGLLPVVIGGRIALALIGFGAWLAPGEPHDVEPDTDPTP